IVDLLVGQAPVPSRHHRFVTAFETAFDHGDQIGFAPLPFVADAIEWWRRDYLRILPVGVALRFRPVALSAMLLIQTRAAVDTFEGKQTIGTKRFLQRARRRLLGRF